MILYANRNHPDLKIEYPIWADRINQIAKIWKNLPNDTRQPYVHAARENRTASPKNKRVRLFSNWRIEKNPVQIDRGLESHCTTVIMLYSMKLPKKKIFQLINKL